jgi:outer membrane lipoprotein-sorting protein
MRWALPVTTLVVFGAVLTVLGVTLAAPAAPPPTVDQIISRYVAARGGLDKIRSIQTLRETGHATAGADRQALVKRELKRPSRTRFEITAQGVTGVFVSNGEHGWKMSPFDGDANPIPVSDEVVKEAVEQADIEGPLVDWKAKGHTAELVGHETVAGQDAYKIKLTLKSGAVRYEYLDVKTLYRLRADSTRQIHGAPVRIQTTFADYKKTDGILFPRTIEVGAEGRPNKLRVTVDKIEVNPPLSDSLFEMPAETQP